jgi:hypothetical protein
MENSPNEGNAFANLTARPIAAAIAFVVENGSPHRSVEFDGTTAGRIVQGEDKTRQWAEGADRRKTMAAEHVADTRRHGSRGRVGFVPGRGWTERRRMLQRSVATQHSMQTIGGIRLPQSLVARLLIVAVAPVASALLTEFVLEARDVARYMPGQTFATVGGARIRYRLLGAERPGVTVVFLSGLNGSIEQADHFQRAVSSAVPSLAHDRAGYGFSEGSTAHSAEQQAKELAALLHALKLEGSVVLESLTARNMVRMSQVL